MGCHEWKTSVSIYKNRQAIFYAPRMFSPTYSKFLKPKCLLIKVANSKQSYAISSHSVDIQRQNSKHLKQLAYNKHTIDIVVINS